MNTSGASMKLSEASFMLLGDAGAGKTTLAGQFPDPYFFDCDKGMMALAGKNVEFDTFRDAPRGGKAWPDRGVYEFGTGYKAFLKRLGEVGKLIDEGKWPYKTLVFDSVTMLASLIMNAALKEDTKNGMGAPQIQHYGVEHQKLRELLDTITSWPGIKILTAHIHRDEDALTGATTMLPLLSPKIGAKAPIYFDEVYFVEVSTPPAGSTEPGKRVLRTDSTAKMRAARSRFGVPTGTEASWQAIRAAVKKNGRVEVDL